MSPKEKKPEPQHPRKNNDQIHENPNDENKHRELLEVLAELRALISTNNPANEKKNTNNMTLENEKILGDLKTIESYSKLQVKAPTTINNKATQTRQQQNQPEQQKHRYYKNGYGGPWVNALRAMRARCEKRLNEKPQDEGCK